MNIIKSLKSHIPFLSIPFHYSRVRTVRASRSCEGQLGTIAAEDGKTGVDAPSDVVAGRGWLVYLVSRSSMDVVEGYTYNSTNISWICLSGVISKRLNPLTGIFLFPMPAMFQYQRTLVQPATMVLYLCTCVSISRGEFGSTTAREGVRGDASDRWGKQDALDVLGLSGKGGGTDLDGVSRRPGNGFKWRKGLRDDLRAC
jgi:hypothetical protein